MNRLTLIIILLLTGSIVSAQKKLTKQLDSINTTEKAKQFLKEHGKRNGKILTFNEEKHKTPFAEEILDMGHGGTKVFRNEYENIHYKVLDKTEIPYYRVNYIMLDGRKISKADIDKIRPQLIAEINKGTPFKDLAMQYSMDQNAKKGGDSGWITYGDMLPEFEQQVMNDQHSVNDVFTVDVESNQWYYVVQKAHAKKNITEVKVLKLVVSKK